MNKICCRVQLHKTLFLFILNSTALSRHGRIRKISVCKEYMRKFMQCIVQKKENAKCRVETKEYMQCRMENNLMTKEDWKNLGLDDVEINTTGSP